MCKAHADGGQRCAAHTRPAYVSAVPGTACWDDAASQHASTPAGLTELTIARNTAAANGDFATAAACESALRRGNSIREGNRAARLAALPETVPVTMTARAQTAADNWLSTDGAAWNRVFDDPDEANGLCTDVAEDFTAWANRNGYDAENVDLNNGGPHTITVLNGTTVADFTHRQFDPGCDVPLVSTLTTFLGDTWDITHRYRT